MSKVLIIGCGGVASVAIHKCCQVPECKYSFLFFVGQFISMQNRIGIR